MDESFANTPEELVDRHMDYARALTHKIARGLPSNVDFDELVGFANLGLTEAAMKFQPDLGVAFTTFAYYRIRGAVFDGLRGRRRSATRRPRRPRRTISCSAVWGRSIWTRASRSPRRSSAT